jgi:hypothetical protein
VIWISLSSFHKSKLCHDFSDGGQGRVLNFRVTDPLTDPELENYQPSEVTLSLFIPCAISIQHLSTTRSFPAPIMWSSLGAPSAGRRPRIDDGRVESSPLGLFRNVSISFVGLFETHVSGPPRYVAAVSFKFQKRSPVVSSRLAAAFTLDEEPSSPFHMVPADDRPWNRRPRGQSPDAFSVSRTPGCIAVTRTS